MNLYLIEAPFQLISAIEAANNHGVDESILLVRKTGLRRNDEQVQAILKKSKYAWRRVISIDTTNYISLLFQLLKLKLSFLFKRKSIDVLALGDYRSAFNRIFFKLFYGYELWFLDDGIATLNLYSLNASSLAIKPESYGKNKLDVYLRKIEKNKVHRIVLKTFLELDETPPFKVETVDLRKAFALEKVGKQENDPDRVYFLGAKLVQSGYLDNAKYFAICERVANLYSGKNIVYLPHREEIDESVSEICQKFDFNVVRPNLPVELYMCQLSRLPFSVVSVCSAALFTISKIYPSLHVTALDFERTQMPIGDKEGFDVCYEYLRNSCLINVI